MKTQKLVRLQKVRRASRTRSRLGESRLRLSLFVSCKHVYAQLIDDVNARTVAFANSCDKSLVASSVRSNVDGAMIVGRMIGQRAVGIGVKNVTFDRGSRRYHGVVSAFADAARSAGLDF